MRLQNNESSGISEVAIAEKNQINQAVAPVQGGPVKAKLPSALVAKNKPNSPPQQADESQAALQTIDNPVVPSAQADGAEWLAPTELGTYQVAQAAEGLISAGSSAVGVGAGVTGVGLAGAASAAGVSLGVAGIAAGGILATTSGWAMGTAAVVGGAAAANYLNKDSTAPTVKAAQTFSYQENSAAGAAIGSVAATDNVGVTGYRFAATGTSTSADGFYSIGANGAVTLTAAGAAAGVASNDFEKAPNSFIYGVQARDAEGNWSVSTDVTFNVTDLDDTAPTVNAAQAFSYQENSAPGAAVGSVAATDNVGVTGYRFAATGTSTSADGFYSIGANGAVTLTAAGAAAGAATNDFETAPNSFTYGVQARDAAGNWSGSTNVTFNLTDLDDTAPTVKAAQAFSYQENSAAGAAIGSVAATDNVGVTAYRFAATGTSTSADGFYSIGANGAVTLTAAGAAAGAATNDFETAPNSFNYGVQARDAAGNWSGSTDVTLNVTDLDDTAPSVKASQAFSYQENSAAGAAIGSVAATDNVGVTGYRFAATGTSISADGFYSIGANGAVTLTAAGAAAGAATNDFETAPNSFNYGVQARDAAGNWSGSTDVTLNVTDLDDTAPSVKAAQAFSYQENSASGAAVGSVAATDNVGVTGYRFAATGTSTSADGFYSIGANGAVTLTAAGAATVAATNDFETAPNSFTYGVQARDAAGNWSSSTDVTLNVTDLDDTAPTVKSAQAFSYQEDSAAGAAVGSVAATDNVGVTGYRFAATGTSTSADGFYSIGANGAVTLTIAGAAAGVASNDFETAPNSFIYGVQARDAEGNWSVSTDVTFNVTDLDDTAPTVKAAQAFSYQENSATGAAVGSVAATDNVGVTGYRFAATGTSTSADGFYSIGANGAVTLTAAGAATVAATNDFETAPNSFTYGVQARDAAGNWSGSTNVTFNLTDLDDTAPTVNAAQAFSYQEDSAAGAAIGSVAATDNVAVTGYRFSATNTSTSADGYFSIGANGAVTLTAAGAAAGVASNDFETAPNSFTYGVQARDAAGNWSASTNVTFNLTDGDDTAPTVTAAQSLRYPENSAANANVGTVAASDNVAVTGYRFSATNTSTSADGYFSIGANGAVTLTAAGAAAGVASNDFETAPNSFTYGVQARDAAGNWSASTNVTFNLTDLSDTVPMQDDWTDGYDSLAGEWGTTGPLSLSGSLASSGYIEVVGDVDVFSGGDPFVSVPWWNGVYEINVTGQLGAADLNLSLLNPNDGSTTQNGGNTLVDFAVQNDDILLSYNASNGATYDRFIAASDLNLAVAAKNNLTGSYNLVINFIDDYADQLAPGGDSTADLGFGTILKTGMSGTVKAVQGIINYQGDVDYWKYERPDGEPDEVRVTVSPNVSLQFLDHQGNAVQAINGSYLLYDTTFYLGVTANPSAAVGSAYRLELFQV